MEDSKRARMHDINLASRKAEEAGWPLYRTLKILSFEDFWDWGLSVSALLMCFFRSLETVSGRRVA